jgi:hypothetical protein
MQSHPDPVWPMPPPTGLESRGQGQGGDRLRLGFPLGASLSSPSITNNEHGSRSSPEQLDLHGFQLGRLVPRLRCVLTSLIV